MSIQNHGGSNGGLNQETRFAFVLRAWWKPRKT